MPTTLTNSKHTIARTTRLAIVSGLLAAAGLATPAIAEYDLNEDGWTIIQPFADTQFVFVSSSEGNDSNSGRTPTTAVRTLARAKQLMRDNSTDWMLLKRGDTFAESFGSWSYSGRSASEPVVITTYGDAEERPIISPPSGHGIQTGYGREISYVAIVGLRFVADRPEHESKTGIRWMSSGEGLLIENCTIEGFKDNITIQGTGVFEDVIIRRSVIVDSYAASGHSQGLFVKNVTGVLLEENIFDANGDNPDVPGATGSGFDQNVYLQVGVTDVVFRGNITSNASGAGAQLRSGGIAVDNLFYQNSLGIRFGYAELEWPEQYASGRIDGNVFLGGQLRGTARQGVGMWIERFKDTVVQRNVVANVGEGVNSVAINLAGFGEAFLLQGNVTHNWSTDSAGHSLKSFIRAGTGSTIMSNVWSMEDTPKLVTVRYSENISFISNTSFADASSTSLFTIDGSAMGYSQWENNPLTDGESMGPLNLPDAGRDLGDYARYLGLADEQAFLDHARSMSRANWDSRFTGAAAADYIRDGYLMGSFADATQQGPF